MESVVAFGQRRGSSRRASSAEEATGTIHPPDLRRVTVLSKAEWQRIQGELRQVDEDRERMREAQQQREALHLQSEEVVRRWSNTIAGQRQKKLEAKRIRDEIEEAKRKQIDKEEANYQQRKRKEAIEKARTQLYYQTDRVRGLHGALLLSEVLKEREAQMELKRRMKSASKNVDKDFVDTAKAREDDALRREQEEALRIKLQRLTVAQDLEQQIKQKELMRERQKAADKRDGEEIERLRELHQREQRLEEERLVEKRRNSMRAHLEHVTQRDLMRATDAQEQRAEEERRRRFLAAKEKMTKLRKDREMELFREAQMRRERIMNKLTATQQGRTVGEERRIAEAAAEQDAKRARQQLEEEERRGALVRSITAHRESMIQEKEQRDKMEKQKSQDRLRAKREADGIFSEKERLKARQIREDKRKLQDFNAAQMAEKSLRHQQLKRDEQEFEEKNAELIAEEESHFRRYSQQVIEAAAGAERNVFPLCKAAREGLAWGSAPVSCGVRPVYLVQDRTGARMPKYVTGQTENIKKINETPDIQEAKRRLGFTL